MIIKIILGTSSSRIQSLHNFQRLRKLDFHTSMHFKHKARQQWQTSLLCKKRTQIDATYKVGESMLVNE
jgi:hypothetical protein